MSLRASEDCGSAASRNDEVRPAHIEALLDPAAHESPGVKPELVETHISWLIFTDEYVYKVKKPVDFGFLDFSTLEKRKHFCSEELRLNQRLSPGVYLGVESIHRAPDGPAQSHGTPGRPPFTLGGEGPVVDYAVKMRRLPDSGWLSGLLERNEVEASLTKRVARRIAHFHEGTPPADVASPGASLDIVVQNTEENFEQTADFVGWSLPPSATNVVQAYTRATLEACRTLFLRREQEGHVRDCHGDLHAGQICVENGIDFIDCIEFNERFRVSDTAADLAFLSMDLEARGHPELSRVLVDAYQNERKDPTLRSVLRFYECYRAFTRGKVESLRAMQLARGSPAQDEAVDAARRYFELARSYATPRGPLLLTLTGLMGTGKSTVARFLGGAWDATVIRSDEVRKDLTGVPEDEHRYSAWKGDIYSDEVTEATYAEMHRRASAALARDEIVVLDGSYSREAWREAARRIATDRDAFHLLVEVRCPPPVVAERLRKRERSGTDVSDGRLELVDQQALHYDPVQPGDDERLVQVWTHGPDAEHAFQVLRSLYEALPCPA